jgi:anaerobic magnesium-protoporphyrin IX monomethyl ester cyclase
MDALLIHGPITEPLQPPLSLAALGAHLRNKGFDTHTWDLSIDCCELLTSVPFLRGAVERVQKPIDSGDPRYKEAHRSKKLALKLAPIVVKKIAEAKAILRDPDRFYDYTHYKSAIAVLQALPQILHASYFPTKIDFHTYDLNAVYSAPNIISHLKDADSNVFMDYFANHVIPKVETFDPLLIAVSISFDSQFLPSLTLSHLLRERFPDVPIILGGAYLTAIADRLKTDKFLWDFATGFVLYEGESALAEACERIKQGKDLAHIPNFFQKSEDLDASTVQIEDMQTLLPPDFSGFPLNHYLVPEPVLPLQSSRGCYWGKCAFCSSPSNTRWSYRQRKLEQFVHDMDCVNAATGTTVFLFCDLSIRPDYMLGLADCLYKQALPYSWGSAARLEPQLDERACTSLAQGGCLNLSFGFESASDRVLSLMRKGTNISENVRVLEACKKAGLGVTVFAIIGFPGETMEEVQATELFLSKHQDLYSFLDVLGFSAAHGCELVRHPEQFNVAITGESPGWLSYSHEIDVYEGGSSHEMQLQQRRITAALFLQDAYHSLMYGGGGSPHSLLYLRRFGRNRVDDLEKRHNLLAQDLNVIVCTVNSDATLQQIDEDEYVLYTSSGVYIVIPTDVAHVVRSLQSTPEPIPAAVSRVIRLNSLENVAQYEAFYGVVLQLLTLIKLDLLKLRQ